MIGIPASSVLHVAPRGAWDAEQEYVLVSVPAGRGELAEVARQHAVAWISGDDPVLLREAAAVAVSAGVEEGRIVLEAPPAAVGSLVPEGHTVAVCPDRHGAQPAGSLEALVVAAVHDGATLIRTGHERAARRAMDVAVALLHERGPLEPAAAPRGAVR